MENRFCWRSEPFFLSFRTPPPPPHKVKRQAAPHPPNQHRPPPLPHLRRAPSGRSDPCRDANKERNVDVRGCQTVRVEVATKDFASELRWFIDTTCPEVGVGFGTLQDHTTYHAHACLRPGRYQFFATDEKLDGWDGGWFRVTLDGWPAPLIPRTDVTRQWKGPGELRVPDGVPPALPRDGLEGEGGLGAIAGAATARFQGVLKAVGLGGGGGGGRLLAVGNAVGAGAGVWECLWGESQGRRAPGARLCCGGAPPPPNTFLEGVWGGCAIGAVHSRHAVCSVQWHAMCDAPGGQCAACGVRTPPCARVSSVWKGGSGRDMWCRERALSHRHNKPKITPCADE